MEFTFHRATESDRTYLRRLNFLADIYGDESKEVRPEQLPDVERYVDEWNPQRDGGVIAFDQFHMPAGGVWLRYWTSPDQGYANLSPGTPEIAIAIENRYAGHRLGEALLREVVDLAREQGATQVALFVAEDNPRARHRYEAFGFSDVAVPGGVMVYQL